MEQNAEKDEGGNDFQVELYYKGTGFVLTTDRPLPSNDGNKTDDQLAADLMTFLLACREKETSAVRFIPSKPFPLDLKEFCPCVYFGRISEYIPNRVYPNDLQVGIYLHPYHVVVNNKNEIEAGRENLLSLLNPPTQDVLEARYVEKYGHRPDEPRNLGKHAARPTPTQTSDRSRTP